MHFLEMRFDVQSHQSLFSRLKRFNEYVNTLLAELPSKGNITNMNP